VLDGQVEVVRTVIQRAEGVFVHRQNRGPDVLDVVEKDPGQGDVAVVLLRCDFTTAERGAVWLVAPAEEGEEPVRFVLKTAGPGEMLETLVQRLIEPDDHG